MFLLLFQPNADPIGVPSVSLYAFYCGPLHRTRVRSHDGHMTLPLAQQGSRVVEILDCSMRDQQQIAVVRLP